MAFLAAPQKFPLLNDHLQNLGKQNLLYISFSLVCITVVLSFLSKLKLNKTTDDDIMESSIYKLFLCDQESGQEGLIDSGDENAMKRRLRHEAEKGHDVWLVSPSNQKILPSDL